MRLAELENPREFLSLLQEFTQHRPEVLSRYRRIIAQFEAFIVYEEEHDHAMIEAYEAEQEERSFYEHYDPHADQMVDLNLPEWW